MKKESVFRLLKHINFLENELKDYDTFKSLSWAEYDNDRHKRRDVERWIENIINSSVDISKIILSTEGKTLPDTYKDIVKSVCTILKLQEEDINDMSELVRLRNIMSHEYLDIRWNSIKRFIAETKPLYENFLYMAKKYLL